MSCREKLGWNVSASVFEDHRDWAREVYGETDGKYAVAVEDAIREFMHADRYAPVEEVVDDVLDALSHDGGAKKREVEGHPVGGRTRTVGHRVDTDLKAEFRRFAREELDVRPGVALSHALHEHYPYGGGRDRRTRLLDKLDAIRSAVEGRSATPGEETREAIVDRLGESFRLSEFVEAAEAVGLSTRKYVIENYLPEILDRTETVPYPNNPRVFIPRTAVNAPENPNPANLPYYAMDYEEKRVALQVAGVRKAWSNGGRTRLTVEEGVDILSGEGSPLHKTVRSVMREATKFDGFQFDDGDEQGLLVNADALDTHGLDTVLAIAGEERRAERDDEDDPTDGKNDVAVTPEDPVDVAERMDALSNAPPVTDEAQGEL